MDLKLHHLWQEDIKSTIGNLKQLNRDVEDIKAKVCF